VSVRSVAKAASLSELGAQLGIDVVVRTLGIQDRSLIVPDAVVSTLPGHAEHGVVFAEAIRSRSVLFDVAYDPWPSALASAWIEAGGRVISGLDMLINQALAQVRIFVSGSAAVPLENESAVLAAMRAAVTP
jgi:shikimate dehydrogenase